MPSSASGYRKTPSIVSGVVVVASATRQIASWRPTADTRTKLDSHQVSLVSPSAPHNRVLLSRASTSTPGPTCCPGQPVHMLAREDDRGSGSPARRGSPAVTSRGGGARQSVEGGMPPSSESRDAGRLDEPWVMGASALWPSPGLPICSSLGGGRW